MFVSISMSVLCVAVCMLANFAAYSPIIQRPYGLGVMKTLLCGWRLRQGFVLCWTSVYSLIRKTWRVEFVLKLTPTEKCATAGIRTLVGKLPVRCSTSELTRHPKNIDISWLK